MSMRARRAPMDVCRRQWLRPVARWRGGQRPPSMLPPYLISARQHPGGP